ncbi:MAG: cytochrome c oxidase subunit 3 [Ardenticatenia bacterium]|nr:cytochrome c oxidase subunit 3 [Ardenticatenia bacterium]
MDQVLGLVITVILLASSLTAYRAETAIAHGDRKTRERNLMGTIIAGTIFLLAVVVLEWPTALEHHVTPHAGFGISLFAMTGLHAFHVLSGVVILLLVWANLRKGGYSAEHHWGVEATVKYWHMVDLVWVFFYPVLYLLGPIK